MAKFAAASSQPSKITTLTNGLSVFVLYLVIIVVSVQWFNPNKAWLHPELLAIGKHIWSGTTDWASQLSTIFDWRLFEPGEANPNRQRMIRTYLKIADCCRSDNNVE
jgi:hypothetical protein